MVVRDDAIQGCVFFKEPPKKGQPCEKDAQWFCGQLVLLPRGPTHLGRWLRQPTALGLNTFQRGCHLTMRAAHRLLELVPLSP